MCQKVFRSTVYDQNSFKKKFKEFVKEKGIKNFKAKKIPRKKVPTFFFERDNTSSHLTVVYANHIWCIEVVVTPCG